MLELLIKVLLTRVVYFDNFTLNTMVTTIGIVSKLYLQFKRQKIVRTERSNFTAINIVDTNEGSKRMLQQNI